MLPTFVIGLREGLEAALIVGIVAAFLGAQGRRDALRQVWIGTGAAIALCVGIGVLLEVISKDLPQRQQEGLETVIGLVAVAMVTYMVIFMRRHSRDLKGDLEHAAAHALASGSTKALVAMAFLGVLREGFETSVFLLATFQHSTRPLLGGIGALLGLAVSAVIGLLIYRGGLKINLSRFFRVTGVVLVVVAAGLCMFALHTAHEAGWVNIGQSEALDLTWLVRPGTPLSSLVTGVLGIQPRPTQIELVAWLAYLLPMLAYVAWPQRRATTSRIRVAGPVALSALLLLGVACGSSGTKNAAGGTTSKDAAKVSVALTSGGCAPVPASVPSGPVEFAITNESADAVTEAELMAGTKILGEKENLTPGLSGRFSLTLAEGSYDMVCPGAKTPRSPFTVTAGQKVSDWHADPLLVSAVRGYETYIRAQVAQVVAATRAFAVPVKAGDIAEAKARYAAARLFYERIEPVAESFGDIDPLVDGRADDAKTPADFTGFHRIEKALWVDNSLAGMGPMVDKLVTDLTRLQGLVARATYSPAEVSRGAGELIDEIQASKITGEEERYSHLDLLDFAGNLDGAMKVVDLLRPSLATSAPDLVRTIDARATAVRAALQAYAAAPGYVRSGYVDYSTVTKAHRRTLSEVVNALGAAIAQIPVKVTT